MRSQPSEINQNLFRAYDIRGVYPEELSSDLVHDLGLAIGTFVQNKIKNQNQNQNQNQTVIVARDGRLSGPVLIQALKEGLKKSGVNVIDIGMVPTPVLYFAAKVLSGKLNQNLNSGVMLTGSHNPANYNGLKMVLAGETIAGEDIQALYQILKTKDYIKTLAICTGSAMSLIDEVQADCFITGDIKYHDAMEAKARGLSLIDIRHYESENHFNILLEELLEEYLKKNKLKAIITASKNPFEFFIEGETVE